MDAYQDNPGTDRNTILLKLGIHDPWSCEPCRCGGSQHLFATFELVEVHMQVILIRLMAIVLKHLLA